MLDKTFLFHEQRRKEMMQAAAHERLIKAIQPKPRPAIGLLLAWTGRRMVDAGRRLQRLAEAPAAEPAMPIRSRTI